MISAQPNVIEVRARRPASAKQQAAQQMAQAGSNQWRTLAGMFALLYCAGYGLGYLTKDMVGGYFVPGLWTSPF